MLFLNHKELKTQNVYDYEEVEILVENEKFLDYRVGDFNDFLKKITELEIAIKEKIDALENKEKVLFIIRATDGKVTSSDYYFYSSIVLGLLTTNENKRDYWIVPRKNSLNEKLFGAELALIKFINRNSKVDLLNIVVLGNNEEGYCLVNKGLKVEKTSEPFRKEFYEKI